MNNDHPPGFKLGTITLTAEDQPDTEFYVAISLTTGDKPAVVLAETGANVNAAYLTCLDAIASGLLRQHLRLRHPHQIDWYVTPWLRELELAAARCLSVDEHLEQAGTSRTRARTLQRLEFRIVGTTEGRGGYRAAWPVLSDLDQQPEALLSELEAAYKRRFWPVR